MTGHVRQSKSRDRSGTETYVDEMATRGTGRFAMGAVALAALALGGCGGSDGGGDTDAFCEQIRALDAEDDVADDDIAAAAEQFEALIGDAPDEIADDLRIVVDAFAELDEIDEDDPEAFELFFELFQRPEFVEATETLEQFGVDECGLEPSADTDVLDEVTSDADAADEVIEVVTEPTDGAVVDGSAEASDDGIDDGEVKATTVPGDPYDEAFWGPIDPNEISIPGIEQHLDVNHPDDGWFGGSLNGSSVAGSDVAVFADIGVDEAARLCDAVLEYAGGIDPDVTVTVEVTDASKSLATGTVVDGCSSAGETG